MGEEAFVIAVGEGADRRTDLFAAPAGGGSFTRLTFTAGPERGPRLHPNGTMVAFLRGTETSPARWSLVVLDLVSNREERVAIPQGAGEPQAVGWNRAGDRVLVRANGYLGSPAPPRALWLTAIPLDSTAWADSLTAELLGEPPAARIGVCPMGPGRFCIFAASGDTTELEMGTRDPIRWGADSVGYFTSSGWEIRPLTGGRTRRPIWTNAPMELRELTYHAGTR